jgi:hypothetical protein
MRSSSLTARLAPRPTFGLSTSHPTRAARATRHEVEVMKKGTTLLLYETDRCKRFAEVEADGLDVDFPPEVGSWSHVLDCRIEPYTEHTLEENCHLAQHVRKRFILVTAEQAVEDSPLES